MAVNGLWEKRWSNKQGDSEPFFGGLQSLTRDLFESQSSGERENVVFCLEKQAEKVVWFLIGVNGPSARRMDTLGVRCLAS